jgi:CRP-like cAMP-binding protein
MTAMTANDKSPRPAADTGSPPDMSGRGTGNRLIDSLPKTQAAQLSAIWERVDLPTAGVLYRQGGPISHVYFPTTGCASDVLPLDKRRNIEVTTVGNEGMVGIHLALGLHFSPLTALSVIPGQALRIPARSFLQAIRGGKSLESLIKRYAAYCLRFASQTIACNTFHTVKQRVCRRLLMAHDRVGKHDFLLTHEVLGQMLGVHRQAITLGARTLQEANFIEYRRGVIKILNQKGLEDASCECYEITNAAYESIVMKAPVPPAETNR